MLKLFKMLQQIVSQLEQICLKLGLKNDYTLAVSNFTRQLFSNVPVAVVVVVFLNSLPSSTAMAFG